MDDKLIFSIIRSFKKELIVGDYDKKHLYLFSILNKYIKILKEENEKVHVKKLQSILYDLRYGCNEICNDAEKIHLNIPEKKDYTPLYRFMNVIVCSKSDEEVINPFSPPDKNPKWVFINEYKCVFEDDDSDKPVYNNTGKYMCLNENIINNNPIYKETNNFKCLNN